MRKKKQFKNMLDNYKSERKSYKDMRIDTSNCIDKWVIYQNTPNNTKKYSWI